MKNYSGYMEQYNKGAIIVSIFLILFSVSAFAQPVRKQEPAKIEAIGKSFGNKITLRWAPNKPEAWHYGNRYGYRIEKYLVAKDNQYYIENPRQLPMPVEIIKPRPLNDWRTLVEQDDFAAVAAQAIYGETFETTDKDDGISSFVNQALELQNRFSFSLYACDVSFPTAIMHGLAYEDFQVKSGEKYLYRIYAVTPKEMLQIDSAFVYISVSDIQEIPKPYDLQIRFDDHTAHLNWDRSTFENIFSGYHVERSSNGRDFHRITSVPVINPVQDENVIPDRMFFSDSLPQNGKNYQYRIVGVTAFGEFSPPSDLVEGMGIKAGPGISPFIVENHIVDGNKIFLKWEYPEELNSEIKNFRVVKSRRDRGAVEIVSPNLPSNSRSFIDTAAWSVNYYRVIAIDLNDHAISSFPTLVQLEDSIPPSAPVGLTGFVDSLGIVRLTWTPNQEPDLKGYSVLVTNHPDQEFSVISTSILTTADYMDTVPIQNLSKYRYYKVAAFDNRYNQSELSQPYQLRLPDNVPPSAPIFVHYETAENQVDLKWVPSSSDDVVKHVLYRKISYQDVWQTIAEFDTSQTTSNYSDNMVQPGLEYDYLIIAVDESGLESKGNKSISVSVIDKGVRPAINLFAQADRKEKKVNLIWDYPFTGIEKFVVYRCAKGEQMRIYKTIPGGAKAFVDDDLSVNTVYQYQIQAIFSNGMLSIMSPSLDVKY